MKKGQIYEGYVIRIDFPNKGIVKIDESEVIVKNVIPGQKVSFMINKIKNNLVHGRLLETLEKSFLETEDAKCKSFGKCGGCNYHTLTYDDQLKLKSEQIKKLIDTVTNDYIFEEILPSPNQFEYRNKMEYSFGDQEKDGPLTLGLHKRGSFYDVITTDDCKIVDNDFNYILKLVLAFSKKNNLTYLHKMSKEGFLRHLLVRKAVKTNEILINIITSSQQNNKLLAKDIFAKLVKELLDLNLTGNIVGILHTYNDSLGDVIQSDSTTILYGRDFIYEELLGLKFKISTFSFFQTNSLGAEVLYSKVREYVGETDNKVLFDLYSGTGTIAQLLAPVAQKVIGVEIVKEAVESAIENAKLNQLTNCEFIAGDVLKIVGDLTDKPDIIILDPP
ncbi:MAG TPA: 23S rRNA (uracil(1939)-C(5))-methyltransferase RlmD, partial [Clostridiales bacterium]|nr:23S rRNA (uracil(1939)-C(5))-methyltransferase RlmD [Clostridiales bacterium]